MPVRPPPRPHRGDVLLAVVGLVAGVLLWALRGQVHLGGPVLRPAWLALLPLAVTAGCEALRRSAPAVALAVGTGAFAADCVIGSVLVTVLMFTDLGYAAVLYGSPRTARVVPAGAVLASVAVTVAVAAAGHAPDALPAGIGAALVTVVPAWTGLVVRQHRDTAAAERLRAERTALLAEQTALLAELDRRDAVAAERARMARELHETVAGHLSAAAIHSTGALAVGGAEGPALEALRVIRENSVAGLAEMRRLIALLRDPDAPAEEAAAPALDALDTVLDRAARTGSGDGLTFTLDDRRGPCPLPAPVELAAYRIVQEGVTNALKHAAPGPVRVVLRRLPHALAVTVTSRYAERPGPRAPGSGAGLVGLRERVALLSGRFRAGARGDRWRVSAVLPVAAGAEGDQGWA
ncbi:MULTISPECIES: sensor histidine kinase [Streptomycetaceae]|uniref:histidine kinase n=1 Tax=Streptantibioticus cattleyicolor (strain ATCC 35852 / DSM 46488 / JCM 4925 / NBRC 14057 / NRRL 8057) TaxID=1003195 RepID=F8JQ95_STREN|nr:MULTISPECIES: histidine kinase [Streptomycetaceae]AEW96558.1 two-component chitin sensor kinase [Streptantibioticus cattleyicolor NRRL 8057 = DSM 46488]MYS61057.1 two-component sensor histidine kinase [Streptomyces sp. SID5468]CCB76895.1 Sensor histidine kinase [Streptantibioticus cattleyicolor NRRL 8057 = DSM 46488]